MQRLENRIAALEQRVKPASGLLPTIIIVPADGPDRAQVLADIEQRRARGENVIAVGEGEDSLAVRATPTGRKTRVKALERAQDKRKTFPLAWPSIEAAAAAGVRGGFMVVGEILPP
ncbi:MAG: hypothetical protein JSS31_18040, partial [Proteobacteria bacterium]|nr:hypothetical protein [Pseudomonadota bacterium]